MKKILLLLFLISSSLLCAQNVVLIDSLKQVVETTNDDTLKINILAEISKQYQSSDPRLCLAYATDALKKSNSINWDPGKVKALKRMGYVMNGLEKSDSSLMFLNQALTLSEKLNDVSGQANIYLTMGLVYNKIGENLKSINCYEKAATIAKKTNQGKTFALAHSYIADIYIEMSNMENAIAYHTKAYKIADSIHDLGTISVTLANLATAYTLMGNYDKAKEYYSEQLSIIRKLGDRKNIGSTLNNIGNLYFKQTELDSALVYYKAALKIGEEIGDKYGIAVRFQNIGSVYYSKGDNAMAIEFLNKSLSIRTEIGDKNGMCRCYINLSECNIKIHQYDKAFEFVTKALLLAKQINAPDHIIHSYQIYSIIYSAKQDFKKAFECKELESALKDSVSNSQSKKEIAKMQVIFDTDKKEAENKLLQKENEFQALTINTNRYLLFGLIGVLLLFVVIAFLIFRQNKLRTAQQTIQLEQKLLRSQMNPHFIFNSLQAIQNFVLRKNEKEAVKYLSSFALLTRSVLENSRMELIPLKKEIALLEDYLALQQLRFGNRFDYHIIVEDGIDTDYLQIPPMLSQPFIENALEHGMKGIESGGLIMVSFSEKDNNLLLEIKDNGKGMSLDESNKKHHSLATTITNERVALWNKKSSKKILFFVAEAYPNDKERKGVKINFTIPL